MSSNVDQEIAEAFGIPLLAYQIASNSLRWRWIREILRDQLQFWYSTRREAENAAREMMYRYGLTQELIDVYVVLSFCLRYWKEGLM